MKRAAQFFLFISIAMMLMAEFPESTTDPAVSRPPVSVPIATVNKFVDAILASDDMTTKMPVLQAAFRDCPEWKQGVERLMREEEWDWAKMYFINFYATKVSKPNFDTLAEMADFLDTHRDLWKGTEPIESMMKEFSNQPPQPTTASSRG